MPPLNSELLAKAKGLGFSDRQIAHLTGTTEDAIRAGRKIWTRVEHRAGKRTDRKEAFATRLD